MKKMKKVNKIKEKQKLKKRKVTMLGDAQSRVGFD
jgi:hypothetical protein